VSVVSQGKRADTGIPVRDQGAHTASIPLDTAIDTGIPVRDTDSMSLDEKIKLLHESKVSWNKIAIVLELRGSKQQRNDRIRAAIGQSAVETA